MSYILDALRRAQEDQQKGQPPDLRASVGRGGQTPRPRRAVGLWVVAAIAVNAFVLAWVLWPRPPEPVAAAPAVGPAPPVHPAGVTQPSRVPAEDEGLQEPVRRRLPPAEIRPLAAEARTQAPAPTPPPAADSPDPESAAAAPVRPADPEPAVAQEEQGIETSPAPVSVPAPPHQVASAGPETRAGEVGPPVAVVSPPAPAAVSPSPRSVRPAPSAAAVRSPAPVAAASVPAVPPLLQDLPPAEREGLPAIEINGHVYAENPGQRFVFINWQSYREGDRIGGTRGPLLERITPEGVVVDFGSVRARVNVAP